MSIEETPTPGRSVREPALPRFEQVADRIERDVRDGRLRPGERVPSVREATRQFGVSAGTAIAALRLLEDRGVIEPRPRSGHYVRALASPREAAPPTSAPSPVAREPHDSIAVTLNLDAMAPDVVRLGAALPDLRLMPTRSLNLLLSRTLRERPTLTHDYVAAEGLRSLRDQIASRLARAGCSVTGSDVVITSGASEAAFLSLRCATKPGDVVVVESPTYFGLLGALRSLGLKALFVPTCPVGGIDLDALAKALRRRKVAAIAVQPNFHNPLGSLMPDDAKRALVALAERHGLPIIEDDTYGDIGFSHERPSVLKSFDAAGDVFYCSSVSKALSPGFRVGWCVPGRRFEAFRAAKHNLNVCSAPGVQDAVARFMREGGFERHLRRLRRAYAEQTARCLDAVRASFPAGTLAAQPLGGHVVWVQMPAGADAMRLFREAAERKISVAPGPAFGLGDDFSDCIRLNCSSPWGPEVERAIAVLGELVRRQVEEASTTTRKRPKRRTPER